MTPEETRQAAAVMLAHAEGKRIEWAENPQKGGQWYKDEYPEWNWHDYQYRVAPERWAGKLWIRHDGLAVADTGSMESMPGWRLIEAKEVEQ